MEGQQQQLKVADSDDPAGDDGYGQEMLINDENNDLEQNRQQQNGPSETDSEAHSAEAVAAAARQNL